MNGGFLPTSPGWGLLLPPRSMALPVVILGYHIYVQQHSSWVVSSDILASNEAWHNVP